MHIGILRRFVTGNIESPTSSKCICDTLSNVSLHIWLKYKESELEMLRTSLEYNNVHRHNEIILINLYLLIETKNRTLSKSHVFALSVLSV